MDFPLYIYKPSILGISKNKHPHGPSSSCILHQGTAALGEGLSLGGVLFMRHFIRTGATQELQQRPVGLQRMMVSALELQLQTWEKLVNNRGFSQESPWKLVGFKQFYIV